MRAAIITRAGGPEVLEVWDVPPPAPAADQVLVRVKTSALNRADILQRMGRYPAPPEAPANIPGLEMAGEVVERGKGARRWRDGDRVFGIVAGGGHAEYVAIAEEHLARVPENLSWDEAGAVPEAFITAHDAIVTIAGLQRGESALVHAVGSGVGLAAAQLIAALGGHAYGSARSADKIARARALGLRDGVVVTDDLEVLGAAAQRWTEGKGIDVVIDLVGGPYLAASVELAAPRGRVVLVGLLAGRSASLNLGALLARRVRIEGTVLRSRSRVEKAAATAAFSRDVIPLLEREAVRPAVDCAFPLDKIVEAHALLESNQTFGKVVIRVSP